MIHPLTIIFLLNATLFAVTHLFAVQASLYWYHWWFDSVMHVWGGALIALGVYAFCTFTRIRRQPSVWLVLGILGATVLCWEVFERVVGLYSPETYVFDTTKDVVVSFSGGLLGYLVLRNYTIG